MRQFIGQTWFATGVFVALCTSYVIREAGQCGAIWTVGIPVTGLILVPMTWWWLVARAERRRPARGAAAGALCVILTMNLAPILATLWSQYIHLHRLDGGLGLEVGFILVLSVSVGGPIGGLVGALVATMQNRWWPPRAARPPRAADGAHHDQADGLHPLGHATRLSLATAVFVLPCLLFALTGGPLAPIGWSALVAIVLVTPPIWWGLSAQHSYMRVGDGLMAGAIIAAIAGLIGLALAEPLGDLMPLLLGIGGLWLLIVPPGAALGGTAAVLEKWIRITRRGTPSSR